MSNELLPTTKSSSSASVMFVLFGSMNRFATFLVLTCLLLPAVKTFGQFSGPEKTATRHMQKLKWQKARAVLNKSLEKDSTNPAINFLLSRWFFDSMNAAFSIDSADRFLNAAIREYAKAAVKERVRLERSIDSTRLVVQRNAIDSAAFERARAANTEGAYIRFLTLFPGAKQRDEATRLRDEAAFSDASKTDTYEAFLQYLNKYPYSVRATEAKNRYERLLYQSRTSNRTLAEYETFLAEHPATPFRREIEQNIFELLTASGDRKDFADFLSKYAGSPQTKIARDILFHLVENEEDPQHHAGAINDSLRLVLEGNKSFLIPFLKSGRFGFMNRSGVEMIPPLYDSLPEEYLCGNVTEDILVLNGRLSNRRGRQISSYQVTDLEDIGEGFLTLISDGCMRVIHKSGFVIGECVENARIVSRRFIAMKRNNAWGLYSFTGRILVNHEWDDITGFRNVVGLKKGERYRLSTINDIVNLKTGSSTMWFDEIKQWSASLLLVRNEKQIGIIDQKLQPVLQLAEQEIEKTFFGLYASDKSGYRLYNSSMQLITSMPSLKIRSPWIVSIDSAGYRFFDLFHRRYSAASYDSISFAGIFAIAHSGDSMTVRFNDKTHRTMMREAVPVFLPGKDSTGFLIVTEDKKRSVFNHLGVRIFKGDYDNIQYAGEGYFIVTKKDKKGLVATGGKLILPLEYDAIGSLTNKVITFLRGMKFGAYHIERKKLIKPEFEKNLVIINDEFIGVFQKGGYSFINWEGKSVSRINVDEIAHWNDSTILARKGSLWALYNVYEHRNEIEGITSIQYINDSEEGKLAIIERDKLFGVWSNILGQVIPVTFTALINVGSKEEPVYFTEKHVSEASIFVVIYYDDQGQMIRREVYEEDDYERILCPD